MDFNTITPFIDRNIIRGTLVEAHISDIHFGIMNPKVQYEILEEQFINKLNKLSILDIISINGDLFDHKFLSNSDAVLYATLFIDKLVSICREKKATLLLIHGTNFHDSGQLKLFYHYLNDKTVDIRIIEKLSIEIVKGKRILCIPEEYNKGENYYLNYLNNVIYDSVYMHGTFAGAIFGKDKSDLNSSREPVFDMNSFSLCVGPIISGHVHVASCYDGYFYYCGSPYRWSFGEEQPKGFLILLHNLDSGEHYVNFEEIQSFRYDTVNLDNMLQQDPKKVIEYVKDLKSKGVDNIRVEFTNYKMEDLELVKTFYKTDPNVKLKISSIDEKDRIKMEAEILDKYKDYDYILDKSLSEYDILSKYINQQKGHVYITSDELVEFLKSDV